jgi:hypothetical protein
VGILPALVLKPPRGVGDILEEPVAVGVSVVTHPNERAFEVRDEWLDVVVRKTPSPRVGEQADPKRRCVDGAVVDGRKCCAEVGVPKFVQDFSWLLIALSIDG